MQIITSSIRRRVFLNSISKGKLTFGPDSLFLPSITVDPFSYERELSKKF